MGWCSGGGDNDGIILDFLRIGCFLPLRVRDGDGECDRLLGVMTAGVVLRGVVGTGCEGDRLSVGVMDSFLLLFIMIITVFILLIQRNSCAVIKI